MSTWTTIRHTLTRPIGAVILLGCAALVWGLTLRSQFSPARRHLETGIEFARQHKGPEAEREWQEAARLTPDDPRPYDYLSEYYIDTHNWPAALDALHQLERRKPDAPHLKARLALCSQQIGDELSAYKYAEASLQAEPNDPATILIFCDLLQHTGEKQRRLDLLRRLAKLQPDNLASQLLLAETLTDKRQFDEARPLVEQILKRDPENAEAYSLRGMILLNTDSSPQGLHQAEADLLRVVAQPRYAAFAHYNLGKITLRLGQAQKAVTHLAAAAQAMPTRREVWFELADACSQAGQPKQSEAARQKAESLLQDENRISVLEKRCAANPGDFEAHLELAQRFLQRADYRKASLHLDQARALRPDDARTQLALQQLASAMNASNAAPTSSGGQ